MCSCTIHILRVFIIATDAWRMGEAHAVHGWAFSTFSGFAARHKNYLIDFVLKWFTVKSPQWWQLKCLLQKNVQFRIVNRNSNWIFPQFTTKSTHFSDQRVHIVFFFCFVNIYNYMQLDPMLFISGFLCEWFAVGPLWFTFLLNLFEIYAFRQSRCVLFTRRTIYHFYCIFIMIRSFGQNL